MKTSATDQRVQRAQSGDRVAAQALLRDLYPRVRNLVRYLVRGDTEVDDITQQVLIDILQGLAGFRGEASFQHWSNRITVRTTLAYVKRRRAQEQKAQEATPHLEPLPAPDHAETYLKRREMVKLLDGLPEAQRHAIVLHHVLGQTVPEIAETLNVSFDTAKSRIRLGMKKLRTVIEDQAHERS